MDEYQCIDARTGMMKAGTVTKPVLILELMSTHDESTAIKYFQCELIGNGFYSAPRQGDFAKLYRITFGTDPGRRFSKSQQLIKHFLGVTFYCEINLATYKKTGECYQKVVDIKPVENQKSELWTSTGTKLKKPRNSQNTLDKKLETHWKPTGNRLETDWKPLGNAKSLQPAETLGLQPFSIPLNHPWQASKTTDTQEIFEQKNEHTNFEVVAIRKREANETEDEFLDRFFDETLF